VLEVLVHLNGVLSVPLVLSGYNVPAAPGMITEAEPEELPEGWNAIPHGQASAALGGGAAGAQPAAQSPAPGHGAGGAGAPGALPVGSTAGLNPMTLPAQPWKAQNKNSFPARGPAMVVAQRTSKN
jgi:hypothetical protein